MSRAGKRLKKMLRCHWLSKRNVVIFSHISSRGAAGAQALKDASENKPSNQAVTDAPSVAQDFSFMFWPRQTIQSRVQDARFFFFFFLHVSAATLQVFSISHLNPRRGLIGGLVLKR